MKAEKYILIVDDNKDIRELTKCILNKIGDIKFFEAENGLQAISVYKNNEIDIILLDIDMPVMNGIQFLDEICKNGKNPKIPIFIMSGLLNEEIINKTKNRGIITYFKKPFKIPALIENIKNYL